LRSEAARAYKDRMTGLALAPAALVVPPAPEPAPPGTGPLELARRMRNNALTAWGRRAYEEDIVSRPFFGRTSFLLNAPDAIRRVLVDDTEAYDRTKASIRLLRPMLGQGLLLAEGKEWRHQRRTLAPAFTPKAIAPLVPHMLAPTRAVAAELRTQVRDPVDLFSIVQRLALEIAGRTMFSLEMDEHSERLRRFVTSYGHGLGRPRLLDFVLPLSVPSPHDMARRLFRRRWTAFLDGVIAERARRGPASADAPRDLFDLMLAARDPETGQAFSPEQLRDQVSTMILAGHETTAVALFWSLYLLALAPEAQERVAEEAQAAGDQDRPALDKLTYTRAVLDEAMRLYPPAYMIARAARAPHELSGMPVKAGDLLLVSPWILQRHERRWRDPGAFDPTRFLPGAPPVDRYAYLPFGIGPRVCIGAHFALTEATLVLATLAREFRFALADDQPVMPVAVITTRPDRNAPFRLTLR
jgi:cytochrome P450